MSLVRDYSFKFAHTCAATSQNFVRVDCNDSEAILSRISALCPGAQTFLWKKTLERIRKSYSFSENDLKHENFGKKFASEGVEAA